MLQSITSRMKGKMTIPQSAAIALIERRLMTRNRKPNHKTKFEGVSTLNSFLHIS